MNYFSGIQSHNTVQFDEVNPMPRISRFLWGNWLKTESEPIFIDDNKFKQNKFRPGSRIPIKPRNFLH